MIKGMFLLIGSKALRAPKAICYREYFTAKLKVFRNDEMFFVAAVTLMVWNNVL